MEEEAKTPYEIYLRQSLVDERARLDSLYSEFARSGPVRKQLLKPRIDEAIQNIDLLSHDLEKYMSGLSWLREPSKERDEKAEHLPKLKEEEAAAPPQAKPATPGQVARPAVARPTIGKPIGASSPSGPSSPPSPAQASTPRPTVGTPAASSRPRIGTPVGTSPASAQGQVSGTQASVANRPTIGTPVGAPKPSAPAQANSTPVAQSAQAPASRPQVGTPVKRPIIGTPIGKPKTQTDDTKDETQTGTDSPSSS